MSAFEDVVEAWGFKIAGDKPAVLSPAGIAPDGSIVYSDAESFRDLIGAEPELGNPSVNGWILSSSSAGVRSWVAPSAHSHAIADVTGLQGALDARMATASYPDLVAIEALAGASGLLRKTAANTWSLDTASYALSSAIPVASSTTPSALGTAAVGTGTTWARADHAHAMPTAAQVGAAAASHNHDAAYLGISATAAAATKLATGRTIGITGDATWTSPAFDGTANVTAAITLASVITAAGPIGSGTTVPVIAYDAKGRLTAVTTATITPAGIGAAASVHGHAIADVTGLQTALDGRSLTSHNHNALYLGISATAAAATKLATARMLTIGGIGKVFDGTANVAWSLAEIGAQPAGSYAAAAHVHSISDVTGLQSALDGNEPSLGNPSVSGHVLASTTAGVRSWVSLPTIPVTSVFGRTGAVVAASGDYTTAQVTESGNLYYTDARARAAISASAPLSYSGGVVSHLATDGNLHVPATSTTNNRKALVAGSTAGSIAWTSLAISHITSLQSALDAKLSTVTADVSSRAANTVYAAPNGSAGTATFRSLVSADIPSLDTSKLTSGTLGYARGGTGISAPGATAGNLRWSGSAYAIDTATYLTANQTITLSGDASGSGSISIAATVRGITVTEYSAKNTDYPVVWDNTERALFHTAAKLKFNPSSGLLSSTFFSSGLNSTTSASFVGNWASSGYWGFAGSTDSGSSAIRAVLCSNLQGAITSLASLSVDILFTGNNGNGTNIKIGDDAWIGDVNVGNVIGLKGIQDGNKGYIKFGSDGGLFGYNGSRLTYSSAFEVTGMSYATGGCTVPQGANVYLGSSQIARQADYVGLWGRSAVWQFGRSSTVYSSQYAVSATFNEGIDALGVSYFSSAKVTTFEASEATLGKVKYTPDSITTNTTLGENSLYLIDSTSDLRLTLPSLSLVRSIKIAVKSSGSYGHIVVPTSGYISWSGTRINGDYLEFQAYPEGAPLGNTLRLKPGLYEFIAVSATRWLCSSSPRIP